MNFEEELKKQRNKLEQIEKDIKTIKRVYLTSLILKVVIIVIPIIGLVISIPYIMDLYEEVVSAVTV